MKKISSPTGIRFREKALKIVSDYTKKYNCSKSKAVNDIIESTEKIQLEHKGDFPPKNTLFFHCGLTGTFHPIRKAIEMCADCPKKMYEKDCATWKSESSNFP